MIHIGFFFSYVSTSITRRQMYIAGMSGEINDEGRIKIGDCLQMIMQLVSRRSGRRAAGFFGSVYSAPDLASCARTSLRQRQRPRGQ